jgi:hydrocephalus-inducing protein
VNDCPSLLRGEWRRCSSVSEERSLLASLDLDDPTVRDRLASYFAFTSPAFKIDPPSLEVWPHRSRQVAVTFTPELPGDASAVAYLCDIETGQRIRFAMSGRGLPGSARFSVQQINVGHIFLDAVNEYRVLLENTGHVQVDFELPDPDRVQNIAFSPPRGTIGVGGSVPILVKFTANRVGQFSETFEFDLIDVDNCHPRITICGRVLGPSFSVSTRAISFGNVSFGFLYTETFVIKISRRSRLTTNCIFRPTVPLKAANSMSCRAKEPFRSSAARR